MLRTHAARALLFTALLVAAGLLAGIRPLPTAAQQTPPRQAVDPRFGAIESFWAAEEAAELGVGWERILFYWNEIQPTGPEDWNTLHVLEEWLVEAQLHNRTIVGLLKNTPVWATDAEPFSGVPRGLYLPIDDPGNLWANYVRRVAAYYAPRGVHNWIIWNEPEIAPGVYGHEFGGSLEDYYRLLKVAYLVMKETDPTATIHLAGWSYWHDPTFLRRFLQVATADPEAPANSYFFDLLSLHIYFRVETVKTLLEEVDRIQNEFGIDKPIWINETNASPDLDPWWPVQRPVFPIDLDQQAWYVVQAHALGFGAGAASIGVYKLVDILLPEGGESFGILRPDFSKRPAFLAYKTTLAQLAGFIAPARTQQFADYFIVNFARPDGAVRVLWARGPAAVTLAVPALADGASAAILVDFLGRETPLTAVDGAYTLTLEGARCRGECLVGGPPVFLVEPGATLGEVLPQPGPPLAVAAVTATPLATAVFTPWPTNTPTPTPTPTATPTPLPTDTPTPTWTPSPLPPSTATPVPPPASAAQPAGEPAAGEATPAAATASWWLLGAGLLLALLLAGYLLRK